MTREELIEIAEQVYGKCDWHGDALNHLEQLVQLIAEKALETKDEPVAIVISESGANVTHSWWHEPALPIGTKLYTIPQQRTWVGLTNEGAQETFERHNCTISADLAGILARAIEAKLKEKNT
jgi:hypothetical protein